MLPSELFRMAFDSNEDKNTTTCSNYVPFVAENDYVDIVWENGQALMSSRTRRLPSCHCSKSRDDMGNASATKYRKFGTMENQFGAPWFDDSSQHEQHCSEFVSGVTANTHNLSSSLGTRSSVRNRDLVTHSRGLVSMNFPQFSLPAALVKASLENRVKETSLDDALKDDKKCDQVCEKGDLGAACSSVCSGSDSIERSSDGDLKRKSEDSEWPSEDEEGSMDAKREARAKRRRVAQVHNLSERVRRDRIKEKMRALQELIPNCNKADKASMLDETIEYVKTLQLQLQVMSMGAGLYAAPWMMSPPAVQPFSMVGMGMNYGMPNMIQVPHMQNTHFAALPMFGASAMHFDPPCP